MTAVDFITELFCRVDDAMKDIPHHSQAALYPSEVVTIGLLYAIKGVGTRVFYRWLAADHRALFPALPERTRLFRRLRTRQAWTNHFLAAPTLLGVADTYGIELLHPIREGRHPGQIGKKGKSNYRWIVGGKLCLVLNNLGLVVAADCKTANVYDTTFHPLLARCAAKMVVLADTGFHSAAGDPPNLKLCRRRAWNVRMLVETVLSMLTVVWRTKKMRHRAWDYFTCHLAYMLAACNILVQWEGLKPDAHGIVRLSLAQFSR